MWQFYFGLKLFLLERYLCTLGHTLWLSNILCINGGIHTKQITFSFLHTTRKNCSNNMMIFRDKILQKRQTEAKQQIDRPAELSSRSFACEADRNNLRFRNIFLQLFQKVNATISFVSDLHKIFGTCHDLSNLLVCLANIFNNFYLGQLN